MSLSRPLLNRTLLWKDWKTSLTVFVPFFFFVTFATTIYLQYGITGYLAGGGAGFIGPWPGFLHFENRLLSNDPFYGFVFLLFTVALAAVPFGRERERETFALLLAMPYSRREILLSKVTLGLLQILITLAINALLMTLLVLANAGIDFPFGPPEIWSWAGHSFLVLVFIFCFAILIATISGTTLGNGILTVILLCFPMGFFLLLWMNINIWVELPLFYHLGGNPWLLSGYLSHLAEIKTIPLWLMLFDDLINDNFAAGIGGRFVLLYFYGVLIILSIGLYKLSQFLFAGNQLEKDGEFLLYAKLEGIFKLGVVVCFTLVGGPALAGLLTGDIFAVRTLLIPCYLVAGGGTWLLVNRLLAWRRAG